MMPCPSIHSFFISSCCNWFIVISNYQIPIRLHNFVFNPIRDESALSDDAQLFALVLPVGGSWGKPLLLTHAFCFRRFPRFEVCIHPGVDQLA